MACQCVEEQVVGSPCPSCPRDDAARLDDLGVEGYDEVHSWDVLDQHDHRERVVGVVGRGCAHGRYHEPDYHLHCIVDRSVQRNCTCECMKHLKDDMTSCNRSLGFNVDGSVKLHQIDNLNRAAT